MKLEDLDELDGDEQFFCWSCGEQLENIDEISQRICHKCKQSTKALKEDKTFFCWACGKKLLEMGEVAQGLCHNCKASIIRKIHTPVKKTVPSAVQK
jgi:DNA-directed RNA polymerase subunit RPC12/RpoP